MYGQFLDTAILDGRNRAITYEASSAESYIVTAILPHFWDYAGIFTWIININFFENIIYFLCRHGP